jgi:uncharacterized protein YciI
MNKKYYFLKLNPPRASFMMDMTDEEKATMQKHVAYWSTYVQDGTVLALGPVADPKGGYGIAIIRVDSDEQLQQLIANDPANGLNKYEYHIMPRLATKY